MTRKRLVVTILCVAGVAIAGAGIVGVIWLDVSEDIVNPVEVGRIPLIAPDYADIVIPPNVAPLNFRILEEGTKYRVRISGDLGEMIEVLSRSGEIVIPPGPWRALLEANRAGRIAVEVCVKDGSGTWSRFDPVVNTVAADETDPYLLYREMPVYNLIWHGMGLCERDLRTDETTCLLHNRSYAHGCMNCHTVPRNRPRTLALNVRTAEKGRPIQGGMLIAEDDGAMRVVDTSTKFNPIPATYLAWHPDGKAVAFSTNKVNQTFHTGGDVRHSMDSWSDLGIYRVAGNMVTTCDVVARPDRLETNPAWSPDGRMIYFCSALPTVTGEEREAEERRRTEQIEKGVREGPVWSERHEPYFRKGRYRELHYDLVRIAYDVDNDTWCRAVETVLSTDPSRDALCRLEMPDDKRALLKSIAQPRISPDGRFILVCLCAFGNFPVYQETSDLYLVDLQEKVCRPLDALNSNRSESWHCWSSNGRWIVFSSKRPDGLLARPWFAHVDENGNVSKPFILPQTDPAFYESYYRTINRPEFASERVNLTSRDLLQALYSPACQQKALLAPGLKPAEGETGASMRPR